MLGTDLARVVFAYAVHSRWRNRAEFLGCRGAIKA
jgi:nuclear transport factor 2 (NTF2) superfamily protein